MAKAKAASVRTKLRKRAKVTNGKVPSGKVARKVRSAGRRPAGASLAAVRGATRVDVGGVRIEAGRAGAARVKRLVYPAGFRWSRDMKPLVGTDLCMHAHAGFLASGAIAVEYVDGCVVEYRAPEIVAIDPGHDGWVVGDEAAVLIEFDFEEHTIDFLDMQAHRHQA